MVPEPQDCQTLTGQPLIASRILSAHMLSTIGLNHEPEPHAQEIDDIRPDGHLPFELEPHHPMRP